jgi:hypothetical protein
MLEPESESKNSPVETPIESTKIMSWSGVRRIVGNWKFGIATTVVFAAFGVYYEGKDRDTEVMLLGEWRCEFVDDGVKSEGTIEFLRQNEILSMRSVFRMDNGNIDQQLVANQVSTWRVRKGGAELVEEPRSISVSLRTEGLGNTRADFTIGSFGSSNPRVTLVSIESEVQAISNSDLSEVAEIFQKALMEAVSDSKEWQAEIVRIDQSQLVLEYRDYVNSCVR